jgi:type IV pilus assembly protein PilE
MTQLAFNNAILLQSTSLIPQNQRGFTLIELMIVVAAIAILTAIAIPSYDNYMIRAQITDGINALATMQASMEWYYQNHRTYMSTEDAAPPCSYQTQVGSFTLSCTKPAPDDTTYTVTATGSGKTKNFVYTINQLGERGTTSTGWRGTDDVCVSTWIIKEGQPCT